LIDLQNFILNKIEIDIFEGFPPSNRLFHGIGGGGGAAPLLDPPSPHLDFDGLQTAGNHKYKFYIASLNPKIIVKLLDLYKAASSIFTGTTFNLFVRSRNAMYDKVKS
jgi:hypothetical protein